METADRIWIAPGFLMSLWDLTKSAWLKDVSGSTVQSPHLVVVEGGLWNHTETLKESA